MLGSGRLEKSMVTGNCFSKMGVSIRVNFVKIRLMAKAFTTGRIKRHIMVSGYIIRSMEKAL